MSSHASNGFYTNNNGSASTLRPRNNRLISYEDDQNDPNAALRSGLVSQPVSRTSSKRDVYHRVNDASHKRVASDSFNTDRRSSSGLWAMASSLLGGDNTSNGAVRRSNSTNTKKTGSRMLQDKNYNLQQSQAEWGPKADSDTKSSSIEEQRAILQAKRRELMLLQGIAIESGQDSLGRFKRKDSNASIRSPVDPTSFENDILVYRHKVQPNDTMAGVVIKYSCQPEAFRKINRFWPNDNIQRKAEVMLPVDACAVKGKKTESPYITNLYDTDKTKDKSVEENANTDLEPFPATTADNQQFRHESWVILPSFTEPVEISRISKKTLGYFPPARRKSPTRDTRYSDSIESTPKTSFDTLRHPPSHAAQQAQLNQQLSLSLNSSPVRAAAVPRLMTSRTRSSSTISTSNGPTQNGFLTALTGPGGVGTLRGLRTERARPGPAEDALNKKFAQYFPDQLPTDHPDYQNPNMLRPPHSRTMSSSLRATPRASIDSIRSTRSNSSSVPVAIAGWVGKVTSSPMRKKHELRLDRSDMLPSGEGRAAGDLIELSDTPDEVSRQLHDAVGTDVERTPLATPLGITSLGQIDGVDGAAALNEVALLNERFPIRGRIRRAYEKD